MSSLRKLQQVWRRQGSPGSREVAKRAMESGHKVSFKTVHIMLGDDERDFQLSKYEALAAGLGLKFSWGLEQEEGQ